MSSWISHLPDDIEYAEIVGHGMNANELAANPRLDSWFVWDLNREATLPLDEGTFDAGLCCVGAQYLQRPVAVFAEVRRVLVAGAPFVVSFSNRCFPMKAVAIWRSLDTNGHAALVRLYLQRAGFAEVAFEVLADGSASDPLIAVIGRA
ncbi:methyltransferase domain-containing protein [Sphingomonas sp. PAMC 26621]|uniref:methyltransferase domain-containing protein n=1 Tax=Sphingomonas sp. PAMC 26621 TaxID=1112213 RepID=UPI0002888C2F|nr:methyltransferase domain-containing protein [Sphingomonas sp. PAMC 26621]